jgi:membrane associated rhomboid family serine protease
LCVQPLHYGNFRATRWLQESLLAIGVTVASWAKVDVSPLFESAMIRRGEFWRLVTSIFPHVGIWHLAFNVYWLWVFGTLVEQVYGHRKTAALILLFAIGSGLFEFALSVGGVGLSGVGYGLFGLLWILSQRDERFRDVIDRKTIELFVIWFFVCIVTTLTHIMPVANIAHGAGAALGILTAFAITLPDRRALSSTAVAAILLFGIWAATLGRPRVNLQGQSIE